MRRRGAPAWRTRGPRWAALAALAGTLAAACGGSAPDGGDGGSLVAFARAPVTGGATSSIHVADSDGTVRRLTEGAFDRAPAWSPDGTQIAFIRSRGGASSTAHVVDLDGRVRALGDAPAEEVAWAPDGERVLLVNGGVVAVAAADGGAREVVAESASAVTSATWSPDGSSILFAGGGGGLQTDLYAVEPGRAGTVRLTRLAYDEGSPSGAAWSPDGERIAFLLPGGVFAMNADGSERSRIAAAPDGVEATSLAWSPDGETIAYTLLDLSGSAGASGVYLVPAEGGEPRRLTSADDVHVTWAPDGAALASQRFTGVRRSQLFRIDVETGEAVPLTGPGYSDTTPAWQPAGDE